MVPRGDTSVNHTLKKSKTCGSNMPRFHSTFAKSHFDPDLRETTDENKCTFKRFSEASGATWDVRLTPSGNSCFTTLPPGTVGSYNLARGGGKTFHKKESETKSKRILNEPAFT